MTLPFSQNAYSDCLSTTSFRHSAGCLLTKQLELISRVNLKEHSVIKTHRPGILENNTVQLRLKAVVMKRKEGGSTR